MRDSRDYILSEMYNTWNMLSHLFWKYCSLNMSDTAYVSPCNASKPCIPQTPRMRMCPNVHEWWCVGESLIDRTNISDMSVRHCCVTCVCVCVCALCPKGLTLFGHTLTRVFPRLDMMSRRTCRTNINSVSPDKRKKKSIYILIFFTRQRIWRCEIMCE